MSTIKDSNPAGSGLADPHAAQVEKLLTALTRLLHGRKLYADNNPRLLQFSTEFENQLAAYFHTEHDLVLTIDQMEIRWRDEVVYKSDRREDSIAFLLHKDGIGEISIDKEALGSETSQLVDIISEELGGHDLADDVVTRFWHADFEHINYRVLDDYLSADGYDERSETTANGDTVDHAELRPSLADKGRIIIKPSDPLNSIDAYLKNLILRTCESSDEEEREAYFQSMVSSFFSVTSTEMAQYQAELKQEVKSSGLADFVDAVMVFTLMQDASAVRDVSGIIERIFDFAAEEKDPATLSRLVRSIRSFGERHELPPNIQDFKNTVEAKITSRELIEAMCSRIEDGRTAAPEALAYLVEVGYPSTNALVKLLHKSEDKRLHKEIRSVLTRLAGDELPAVIDRLDLDNTLIALDAVSMCIEGGVRKIGAKMLEMFFYPDRQVKLQMLDLAGSLDANELQGTVLKVLDDPDPTVRCKAMAVLAEMGGEAIRARMEELAFEMDLGEREFEEQEVLFKSVGRNGNDETVAKLSRFVDKKSLVLFGKNRENKFLAIRALEGLLTADSIDMLNRLSEDGNSQVAARARRAYALVNSRMTGEKKS